MMRMLSLRIAPRLRWDERVKGTSSADEVVIAEWDDHYDDRQPCEAHDPRDTLRRVGKGWGV
jgi:hypothetical protein